jgi:aspartyl-tRNA synthetase
MIRLEYTLKLVLQERKNRITPKAQYSVLEKVSLNVLCKIPTSIESGDEEAMMPEWEFVEMLEHGMPPTCGFGFGERLFAFLVDKPLRETQLFPLLKPKND